jgi:hypothetical protein
MSRNMIFKKIVLVAVFFIFIFSVTQAGTRWVCEPASMTDAMMRI